MLECEECACWNVTSQHEVLATPLVVPTADGLSSLSEMVRLHLDNRPCVHQGEQYRWICASSGDGRGYTWRTGPARLSENNTGGFARQAEMAVVTPGEQALHAWAIFTDGLTRVEIVVVASGQPTLHISRWSRRHV